MMYIQYIYFNVRYIKYETPVEDVRNAIRKEMEGPGRLLGVGL